MRVCMVSYSFYETDSRIINYAEALVNRGDQVDIIALKAEGMDSFEIIRGVNVYRIQERKIDEKSNLTYLRRLLKFFCKSTIFLTKKHYKDPYQLIHVHSIPDFQVFCACLVKLKGAKVILDIHDILPEYYASKFQVGEHSIIFKTLVNVENISAKFADHVIIANHLWGEKIKTRSVTNGNLSVFINYPDTKIFHPRPKKNKTKFVAIYPGSLSYHQGLDIAISAIASIKDKLNNFEFHIYGEGTQKTSLKEMVADLKLEDFVIIKDILPIEEIAEIVADADLGIVPKRNDPFGGDAFSTKIMEFMSSGIPVIASKTRVDSYYFNDNLLKFFEPDNHEDLAESILMIINDKDFRNRLIQNSLMFSKSMSWDSRKSEYYEVVDFLTGKKKKISISE